MEDNGNSFFEENERNTSSSDNYNSFGSSDEGRYRDRSQRPRFVKVEYGGRPQYSRVERQRSDDSYGQSRSYGEGRSSYGENRSSYGENRGSYGEGRSSYGDRQYGSRSSYGQQRQGGYQQRQGSYGQDRRSGYAQDSEGQQPRFYRERVQGQEGAEGQQRQYRPRREDGGYGQQRQGGYQPRQNSYGQQRPGGFRKPAQKQLPKGKRIEYTEAYHNPDEEIRLNKYLANAGVCSRREADDFIKAGVVKVNGKTATELGTKVKRGDNVLFHDQLVNIERKIYILLNKPKDCVTTVDDPQERKTVMDYVKNACRERIYPVGRLDRNTTGVLLLTNDGELATRLMHPKYLKKKIYHARLDRAVSAEDLQKLLDGVNIGDDIEVHADEANYVNDDKTQVGIEIHSGRNRVVRRMFDALGYKVMRLDRTQFAGLTKKRLRRGDWRFLTDKEVSMLRMGAYE